MRIFLLFFLFISTFSFAQEERCSHVYRPLNAKQLADQKRQDEFIQSSGRLSNMRLEENVYTIPVVVHIIYKADVEFVDYDQIFSQIEVLNQDYRRKNADTALAPSVFKSIAADANIEFALARRDPSGKPTYGITYTKTTNTSFTDDDGMKFTFSGGIEAWDPSKYLNIWVCNLRGGVLGYFPYPMNVGSVTDGVVISYRAFGKIGNLTANFNKGRTATHEIGHWFGLYHPWGVPNSVVCSTDFVDDTPAQATSTPSNTSTCPIFPYVDAQCNNGPNGRIFSDFMDYTKDACMNMFTKGQVDRLRTTLLVYRTSILTSNVLQAPFENDISVSEILVDTVSFCNQGSVNPRVRITNSGSDTLNAYKLTFSYNGVDIVKNWTGKLLPGKDTVWLFDPISESNSADRIDVKVELAPSITDEYANNNNLTKIFGCRNELGIYPNPVMDVLKIRGNYPKVISATFYNLAGKELLKINDPFDIDVTGLQSGFYLVVFQTEQNTVRHQFIVIH